MEQSENPVTEATRNEAIRVLQEVASELKYGSPLGQMRKEAAA